eukprot:TRINITY_DN13667_c0_g1_i1.p1 TRINITY_DN13667_c0_g1~~TRINITY_DN13667_c0_g1_i1.p1  ORF type:complete len:113 (+),score=20.36 TRINITY_DN13667_c0_g1_i1:174-512(+)
MCIRDRVSYKPHYACFECRKSFKRRLASDIRSIYEDQLPAKCPDCGALAADMGLDFKAPKMKDEKAWKHLRNLFQVGITSVSYTHLRAHETVLDLVCRLLLEKKKSTSKADG